MIAFATKNPVLLDITTYLDKTLDWKKKSITSKDWKANFRQSIDIIILVVCSKATTAKDKPISTMDISAPANFRAKEEPSKNPVSFSFFTRCFTTNRSSPNLTKTRKKASIVPNISSKVYLLLSEETLPAP